MISHREDIWNVMEGVLSYCEKHNYQGYDPYDGLNSWIIQATPLRKSKWIRWGFIQFSKISPINFRPIMGIHREQNPKALALFLSTYVNLRRSGGSNDNIRKAEELVPLIKASRSPGYEDYCWGYNFDWQSRTFFLPKFTPTVVVTSFVAESLLDLVEVTGSSEAKQMAESALNFILTKISREEDEQGICFSYSPVDRSKIFNASLLAGRLLARFSKLNNFATIKLIAEKVMRFALNHQNSDGSWYYGKGENQRWIDHFHTGYNLECLKAYQQYTGDQQFQDSINKGFQYYLDHFFEKDRIPKYYPDQVFPIDIHCASQAIRTLVVFGENSKVKLIIGWVLENMLKRGLFVYQKNSFFTNSIPYVRWSQAWMVNALSFYLKSISDK